jgi:tetratricopeptide (TPR) repeat protein
MKVKNHTRHYFLILSTIFLLILFLSLILFAQEESEFTALGDSEFRKGNYDLAIDYYWNAITIEESPESHYKLAQLLSFLRTKNLICEYDAYIDGILDLLSTAIEIDESYKTKILEDTLFWPIHGTLLYNTWKGGSIDLDSSIMKILPEIDWQTVPEGVASLPGSIVFTNDGQVEVDWGASYEFVEFDEKTGEPILYSFGKQKGTYTVTDGIVYITWKKIIENEHSLEVPKKSAFLLKLEGVYGILDSLNPAQEDFYDIPDECSA